MKKSGQDLLKDLEKAERDLLNAHSRIQKKFEMIIDKRREYMTEDDKQLIINSSLFDMSYEQKCEIIMRTEAEYVRRTSKQGDLFG